MDKYEYRVKTEQMLEHMEHKRYKKAMEIADTIDWKRVKNPSILNSVSEIYEYNGEFKKSRDVLFMAYDRAPNSRKTVYRLGTLALKINDIEEASDCYEEFVKLAPKDPNQYILKYKILKARRAPLVEQIEALEDFKKAEYIEKWAYELARLYDQAGMTAECLEECDDLILWFSEGKYVYQAMELKMKYKPLTPLQQERYESQKKGIGVSFGLTPEEPEDAADAAAAPAEGESVEDIVARMMSSVGGKISDATNPDMKPVTAEADEEEEPAGAGGIEVSEGIEETDRMTLGGTAAEPEPKKSGAANIRQTVKGATLAEALRNGFAVANGIDLEPKTKAIDKRDEDLRITGQMKIEEILMEWEAKQRENAKAIDSQRKRDEEARAQEKLEAEKRREEEARRIEKQQRAAEEARRHAEMRAAEEKRRLAARKAEEERILAEQKAEEERRQAILKAEEEERFLERLAAGKAAQNIDDEQTEQREEESAAIDGALGMDEFEDESYEEAAADEFEDESYEEVEADEFEDESYEEVVDEFEDESYEEAEADKFEDEPYEEAEADKFEDESYEEAEAEDSYDYEDEDNDLEEFFADQEELLESTGMTEDLRRLMQELEAGEAESNAAEEDGYEEETYEEVIEDEVKADAYEDEAADAEFEEASYEETTEAEFEEESYEEAAEDKFEGASHKEEKTGEPEESYAQTDEDDFEEDYVGNYDEETYDGDWDDFDEDDFEEETLEDAIEEAAVQEEIPVIEEPEPVKPVRKKKPAKLEKKPEEELPPAPKAKKTPKIPEKPEELTIEEPTEEEIQKRIKKGKGGMPFDTGFVVTGRYDLSATSEIGLRAGLTEEQKKLFSYFVPVRGMSEQIVEVLDNDRREKREGTSRTGNIIVMGQKGSGKTVLAVDIVKAIQKQRNLKQGKVAIVTGESLNKKELTSIIQKLRGGAIIIEKAGKLNTRTIKELNRLLEKKTGELLVVLEDQKKPLERIFTANPSFKKKFTSRLELPAFINDELVTFGQTYAKESGYKLDEMGILALYSRIDVMQREDHSVTVAEVKEIMDEAIEHSKKANVKHFARRVFGKGTDDSDRIILKEDDFRI